LLTDDDEHRFTGFCGEKKKQRWIFWGVVVFQPVGYHACPDLFRVQDFRVLSVNYFQEKTTILPHHLSADTRGRR